MDEQKKEIEVKEIQKKISEIMNIDAINEILKSNEAEFVYKDVKYRVKKPNYQQKQETYQKKLEKFSKLLDEVDEEGKPKYKLEEDLKKSFLRRGIDIDSFSTKMFNLNIKRDGIMLKLGEALKNNADDLDCKTLKKEIENITSEIQEISIKKTQMFESSIESQCLVYFYTYLSYLLGEKYVVGKDLGEGKKETDLGWVRVWNTWEEFKQSDEGLLSRISYYTTLMSSADVE